MIREDGDVESYTEASSPTPVGQESVTPTDLISDYVQELMDEIEHGLVGGEDQADPAR